MTALVCALVSFEARTTPAAPFRMLPQGLCWQQADYNTPVLPSSRLVPEGLINQLVPQRFPRKTPFYNFDLRNNHYI